MSLRGDGHYRCDRCDGDVINGGVLYCVIVSDLDPVRPGEARVLHFCRENGCNLKVLSDRNLAALRESYA